tara:strand:+ start:485 stop:976 length:492 start_codon:yes stop_codon:yes gene_type:complete
MKRDKYYLDLESKGHYEIIDRRSKDYREYKAWKAVYLIDSYKELKENVSKQPKGLGDSIAKITKVTGIARAVKAIVGEDCGCDERKDKLNKIFNYKKLECISEDDYVYLKDFFSRYNSKVTHFQKVRLIEIYNFVFTQNENTTTSCSSCMVRIVKNLKKYLDV